MAKIDCTYNDLLRKILDEGFKYEDANRKGVHRIQIPTYTFKHDFENGFPAITTKKLYWKGVVGELLWFLRGDTNIKYLVDNGINIWNKDAANFSDDGSLGRVYGAQWREWLYKVRHNNVDGIYHTAYIDQIANLIKGLKENPMGTRHIVTAWNPAELNDMALPPCHWSFEILVEPLSLEERVKVHDKLHIPHNKAECDNFRLNLVNGSRIPKYQFTLKWHQRSVDTFLGLPFNIASYALLSQIIGKLTNMKPKGIIGDLSNVHIYEPHLAAVKEQLSRSPHSHGKCELECFFEPNTKEDITAEFIDLLKISHFELKGYTSEKGIPADMLAYNK